MSNELKRASAGPAYVGAIVIFLLFAVLVWVWMGLGPKAESFEENRAAARLNKLNLLEKENHGKLYGYAWVNKTKKVVQLPIDRAQELVLVELKAKPVQPSSVKVEVPYPAGLQQLLNPAAAPAVSASPAAAASPQPASPTLSPVAGPVLPTTSPGPAVAPGQPAGPEPVVSPSPAESPASSPSPSPSATPLPESAPRHDI